MITAMAIDPADSKILYVVAGDKKKNVAAFFVSQNQGASWTKEQDLPELAEKLWVNPQSPKASRTVLIAGSHFLMEKKDGRVQETFRAPGKNFYR